MLSCVGTCQGNKPTCNSSGNTWPQSSQLAEPLLTDPGLKDGIGVRELISTLKKKKKKKQVENDQKSNRFLQAREKAISHQ